jgi:hypothetical protein
MMPSLGMELILSTSQPLPYKYRAPLPLRRLTIQAWELRMALPRFGRIDP